MKFKLGIESDGFQQYYVKRHVIIPSRFFFAPVNTGLAFDGLINDRFINFHNLRSGHRIGITYVGNVAIGRDWTTNKNTPTISFNNINEWRKVVAKIVKNGSVPAIQLACRTSKNKPLREWKRHKPDTLT